MSEESCISVAGIACSAVGALFYILSQGSDSYARQVASAHVLDRFEDAVGLEATLPLLVALRGRADAVNPKGCVLCDARAVHHELIEEDILVTRSAAGHAVRNPYETRRELTTTDWYLDDGSGPRVRVEGTRGARMRNEALEIRQDYRESVEGGVTQSLAQLFTGHKTQGYKRKETFIPVGAILTVVGELTRNALPATGGGARFVVRPPRNGEFFISSLTAKQLCTYHANQAFWLKMVAAGFGGLGAFLIAKRLWRRWQRRRREKAARLAIAKAREQKRLALAAKGNGSPAGAVTAGANGAMAAGGDDRDADTCVVCLEGECCMVYVACGHMCVCASCGKSVRKCPVCRAPGEPIRVFRM